MGHARSTLTRVAMVGALVAATVAGGVASLPEAEAVDPTQVSFTLTGCARTPQTPLPNDQGEFICPNNLYTSGNLGSNWAELDLVPMRLEARAKQTQEYTIAVAATFEDAGVPGFDAISEPVLNVGLSDVTCTAPVVSDLRVAEPGLGGADATGYRNVTISTRDGETCVYDWHQRLAVGSSGFPGSSLSSQLAFEDLDGTPGQATVSLPVAGLEPQGLSKSIEAARGDGYLWSVHKSVVPVTPEITTCAADPTATFTSTIEWTRTPVTGEVTWVSTVFASNPSVRPLLVEVTDTVFADGEQIEVRTGEQVELPAGAAAHPVLIHSGTAPQDAAEISDQAVARYTDPVSGATIPETTSASASTDVTVHEGGNNTAELTDVTTTSGAPISIDKVTSGTTDPALGVKTTDPITWESGTVSGSGKATLTFTAHVGRGVTDTVSISDEVTLVHGAGSASVTKSAQVLAKAAAPTIGFDKVVDVAPTADASFRFDVWRAGDEPDEGKRIASIPVTVPAGQLQAASVAVGVPPSPDGYVYREISAQGYTEQDGSIPRLAECDQFRETVEDSRLTGTITVSKVLQAGNTTAPAQIDIDCDGDVYHETLEVLPGERVESGPIPSGTQCTISEVLPPPGYELVSIKPENVKVPAGDTVEVVVTNTRQTGQLQVTKVIEGVVGSATTTFPITVTCGDEYDQTQDVVVPDGETSATVTFDGVPTGVGCSVTENVPDGWALADIDPEGEIVVKPGEPAEVTVTDERLTGSLIVNKQVTGPIAGADTAFSVDVTCDDGFTASVTLDVDETGVASEAVDGISTGADCTVDETGIPDGWELVGIEPEEVTIGDDPDLPKVVTVTNARERADFDVVKQVDGPIADPSGEATFLVEAVCEDGVPRQVALTVTEDDGTATGTFTDVPTGIECTVTEDPAPDGWTLTSIDPSPVIVTSDDTDTVTVVNTRTRGDLVLVKRLDGDVAGADTSFTLDLDCDMDEFDQQVVLDVTDGTSAAVTVADIPVGVACVVTEAGSSPDWRLQGVEPAHVVVGDTPVEVVATNERVTGGLVIRKALVGPVAGAPTTFAAHLDCDGTAHDRDLELDVTDGAGGEIRVTGIPAGITCTFTEVDIPPEWQLGGYAAPPTIVIPAGDEELVDITAVNTRVTGDLTVVKAIDGAPSDEPVTFDIMLDCDGDLFDTAVPVDVPAGESSVSEHFSGIPTGVTCAVSEDGLPDGWELVSIGPGEAEVVEDSTAEFTVTNRQADRTPEEPPGDDLPDTGGMPIQLLPMAALAIVAGAVVIARNRRRSV